MTNFTDLPREIRDMIYPLCLKEDRAIFPYPERHAPVKALAAPPSALLRVSKSIRAEVISILCSINTFQIGPSLSANHVRTFESWESNKHLVRHIKLYVTYYDIPKSAADLYSTESPSRPFASICHSMAQILDTLGTLSTLTFEVQDLYLGGHYLGRGLLREPALKGLMCSFHERVNSLVASGCTITVSGLQDKYEARLVQSKWPFAVTTTSPPKNLMW